MAQAPDTTTLEYSWRGAVVMPDPAANRTVETAAGSFADVGYRGFPAAPIYGHPSDSGTTGVTFTASGSEAIVQASHGNSGNAGGGLGGHTTHPGFAADTMYLEKYTFADGVTVVQYQWQYQGTPSSTEHWKLTVYYDDGSGTSPGILYYQGAEQTLSILGAGTSTASVSPTDLTIPGGIFWIGVHVHEANLAPTHTGGGAVDDAPDLYSDGAASPFVNGVPDTNLRDTLITYTTSPGLGFQTSRASEAIADSGADTVSFTPSQVSFTGIDSGADTVTFTTSASEALVDQGADDVTLTPSTPSEPISDAGADTVSFTDSMVSEAIAEVAADDVVFTPDQTYSVTTAGVTDAGDDTVSFTDSGAEAIADQGADTVSFTPARVSEAIVDQGATAVSFTTSKVREAIAESTSQTVTFTATQAEAIADSSTVNTLEITAGAEAIAMSGATTVAFTVSSPSQAIADAGLANVLLTPAGSYTVADAAFVTIVFTPDAAEALVDATETGVAFTATASREAIADQGAEDVELTADVSGDVAVADTGTVQVGSDLGQLEAIADQGAEDVLFVATGRLVRVYHYGRLTTNVTGVRDGFGVTVTATAVSATAVQTASLVCTISDVTPLVVTVTELPALTAGVS